jgi:predicted CoA-binding protein
MDQVEEILRSFDIVAIVGMSSEPDRPSFRVGSYLKEHGYRIIPVNPSLTSVLGEICYPSLTAIPGEVQIVDVFRQGEALPPIAEEAIAMGASVLWMQEGVINEIAAARAREAGLLVVMDRCMRKEHIKLKERQGGRLWPRQLTI